MSNSMVEPPKRVNRAWSHHQLQFKDAHEFLNWIVANLEKIHAPEEAVKISRFGELTQDDIQQISSGKYRIPRGRICAIPSDSKRSLPSKDVQQASKPCKSARRQQQKAGQNDQVTEVTTQVYDNGVTSLKSTQEHIDPFSQATVPVVDTGQPAPPPSLPPSAAPSDMSGQFNCWPHAMPSNPRDVRLQSAMNQWPHMVGLPSIGPMFSYGQQPANLGLMLQLQSNLALQQIGAGMRPCWPSMSPLASMIGLQGLAGPVGYQGVNYGAMQGQFHREYMGHVDPLSNTWHGTTTRQKVAPGLGQASGQANRLVQSAHGLRSRGPVQDVAAGVQSQCQHELVPHRVTRRRSNGQDVATIGEKRGRTALGGQPGQKLLIELQHQQTVKPPQPAANKSIEQLKKHKRSSGDLSVPRARRSVRVKKSLRMETPSPRDSRDSSEIPRWRRPKAIKQEKKEVDTDVIHQNKRSRNAADAPSPHFPSVVVGARQVDVQTSSQKRKLQGGGDVSGVGGSDADGSGDRRPATRRASKQHSVQVDNDQDDDLPPKVSPTGSTGNKYGAGMKTEIVTASSDNKDKVTMSQAGSEATAGANWLIDAISPNDQHRIPLSKLFQGNMHYWMQCSSCAHYTCTQQVFTEIPVHFQRQPPISIPFGSLPTTTPFADINLAAGAPDSTLIIDSLTPTAGKDEPPAPIKADPIMDSPPPSPREPPKGKTKGKKRAGKNKGKGNSQPKAPRRKPQILEYYGSISSCLEGCEEVGYNCSKCHSKTAVRRYKPERAPDILIFQLFVFDFDQRAGDGTKLKYFAEVPETLSLGLVSGRDVQYDLRASVCHLGSNLSTGHYTVYVKHMEAYYYIDNQQVIPVKDKALMMYHLSTASYLVFYSKKADENEAKVEAS